MHSIAIIGGGPAGLMAAEALLQAGHKVSVYDAMPSVGRKFLMAGKGGLNLTHAEPLDSFLSRYGTRRAQLEPLLADFSPDDLRAWVAGLGIQTFVGSSGRVFPQEMKAAPLLRAWLHRLREQGAMFCMRHRWLGWDETGALRFATEQGERLVHADAVILAVGGGSWAKLGSDGAWMRLLAQRGVDVAALQPSNCGFDVDWSAHFIQRFAGQVLKSVLVNFVDAAGVAHRKQGDCVITQNGIEGGVIYALSAAVRDTITALGSATIYLDLIPNKDAARVLSEINHPRGSRSQASHLQSRVGLKGAQTGLLREVLSVDDFNHAASLCAGIKAAPIRLVRPRPIDEAISSAGGVRFEALNASLMLQNLPGVFCAGEMLDWEAPTGGYLLTACLASGRAAGQATAAWLHNQSAQ